VAEPVELFMLSPDGFEEDQEMEEPAGKVPTENTPVEQINEGPLMT
jgi:hypothetical protein